MLPGHLVLLIRLVAVQPTGVPHRPGLKVPLVLLVRRAPRRVQPVPVAQVQVAPVAQGALGVFRDPAARAVPVDQVVGRGGLPVRVDLVARPVVQADLPAPG